MLELKDFNAVVKQVLEKEENFDTLYHKYGNPWLQGKITEMVSQNEGIYNPIMLCDLAKIAYLLWLKKGFWLKVGGLKDVLDTPMELRQDMFDHFIEQVNEAFLEPQTPGWYKKWQKTNDVQNLPQLIQINFLAELSRDWNQMYDNPLYIIYSYCYLFWKYGKEGTSNGTK